MKASTKTKEDDEALKIKLLQLIEEGDPTAILSSEFADSLNELIKMEMISLEDERLQLTERGQQAKLLGIKAVMEPQMTLNEEIQISDFPEVRSPWEVHKRPFLIVLFFFLISLFALISSMDF